MIDFNAAITALRTDERENGYGWVYPTPEELDIADELERLQTEHGQVDPPDDEWCMCGERWCCEAWLDGEALAFQAISRGADRYLMSARAGVEHLDARKRGRT